MPTTGKRSRRVSVCGSANGKKQRVVDVRACERLVAPASCYATDKGVERSFPPSKAASQAVEVSDDSASIQKTEEVRKTFTHLVTPPPSMIDLATLDSISLQSEEIIGSDSSSDFSVHSFEPQVSTLPTKETSSRSMPLLKYFAVLVTAVAVMTTHLPTFGASAPEDSVCVSGGGFSGFWFTLGRLDSIPDPAAKQYYCYSAGCLGVVATLSGYKMEEMWDMAYSIQNEWKSGEIGRYEVVPKFIDNLLYGSNNSTKLNPDLLPLLNIETTVRNGRFGVTTSVRTPESIESLRTMLVQTAWIPFAVGDELWHLEHMDGAFSIPHHPPCEYHVGLALDLDLLANVINVNLGRPKVEKFWNKGLSHGI